jgi:serine phosphatase RsbU (regulator of sigma subunit)
LHDAPGTPRRSAAARTRRWLTVWLIAAALLAVLLLANSVRDYVVVWRILATQQVRHRMAQYVVALEQALRRSPTPALLGNELPAVEPERTLDDALWIEVRRPDGSVLALRGSIPGRTFTLGEEISHFRSHEPLYRIVPSSAGDAVVEVFPLRVAGVAPSAGGSPAQGTSSEGGRRPLFTVEIATPLAVRDRAILWPIRQNLIINCTGAFALLATVVIAALALRSYERRRWLEAQLEIAREVQGALLPARTDDYEAVRLASVYRPAEQVGGDFYDAFRAEDARIALVIGDVSGKGVPSALLAGMIHGAVRSAAWTESGARHVDESVRLNRLLCSDASGGRYASMFWCYYDVPSSRLHYVNAGHFAPILVTGDGGGRVVSLEAGGPVLGVLPDARYEEGRCQIHPGDTLVLYSDGLTEATNAAGEEYGLERLRELVGASGHADPHAVKDAILASVSGFLGTAAPQDDLTLVVARFGSSASDRTDERPPVSH